MYWIDVAGPGRIAISAKPRSGEWLSDEIAQWRLAGVDLVVSLLEAHEVHELGLRAEGQVCEAEGIAFVAFPIADRGVPESLARARALALSCAEAFGDGQSVLVHCRAGIGRSSLIAACVLASLGVPVSEALPKISAARGTTVPDTQAQIDWVQAYTNA